MLTGGIDLSVGAVASMAAFVMATLSTEQGPCPRHRHRRLLAAALAGLVNGVGVGIFKVHPLIMTLGMGLVAPRADLGLPAGDGPEPASDVPDAHRMARRPVIDASSGFLPNNLLVFIPMAALIIVGLRRSGYGRLLFAVGDNPIAARLAGARVWQVLVALYIISALLAAIAGFLVAGLVKTASHPARRVVGAAVGGRRGHRRDVDHGRPRRLRRHDRRGADPDRPDDAADRRSTCPRRSEADAVRR